MNIKYIENFNFDFFYILCIKKVWEFNKVWKGRLVDALALRGDEGRSTLR